MKYGTAIVGVTLAVGLVSPSLAQVEPPKPAQIIVNASGGASAAANRAAYFSDFEKDTGIRVVDTSPIDYGKLRSMAANKNVTWSIVELRQQDAMDAKQAGILAPLDPAIIDRSKFIDRAKDSHIFFHRAFSSIMAYRQAAFPNGGPKTWADFWDVKRFPGPRSLENGPYDNLVFALLADGVPADKVYPIDMDRAFKKLDQIYPHIAVWWTTGAQPGQLLVDKEVDIAVAWSTRLFDLKAKNAPLTLNFNGGQIRTTVWAVPKDAKDNYWAQRLLSYMTDPKRQAKISTMIGASGTNTESLQYVPENVRPLLSLANAQNQVWTDYDWWTKNGAEAVRRWNAWMLKRQ